MESKAGHWRYELTYLATSPVPVCFRCLERRTCNLEQQDSQTHERQVQTRIAFWVAEVRNWTGVSCKAAALGIVPWKSIIECACSALRYCKVLLCVSNVWFSFSCWKLVKSQQDNISSDNAMCTKRLHTHRFLDLKMEMGLASVFPNTLGLWYFQAVIGQTGCIFSCEEEGKMGKEMTTIYYNVHKTQPTDKSEWSSCPSKSGLYD